MKTMKPGEANKRGNVVTARIVPVFLLGIIGYSTWVLTDLVCVRYLISPAATLFSHRDVGAAIAILVIYYLLLLLMLICLGRLVGTILTNPGLVPRGEQYWIEKERRRRVERSSTPSSNNDGHGYGSTNQEEKGFTPPDQRRRHHHDREAQGYRVQDFWHKDVFVCGFDGRLPFCSTCYNYKPDRAHHCRELGRCVLKMDHFCPWVGGIVSETSFKFFIQFTGWAAVFCLHTLVVMAYYLARRRSEESGFLNVHLILVLVFAGLFFVFTLGMCGSSLQFAFLNSTTIENFTRKTKIWYLAVYLSPATLSKYQSSGQTDLRLITYPRPKEEQIQLMQSVGATIENQSEQNVTRQEYTPSASARPLPPRNTYEPHSATPYAPQTSTSPEQTTTTNTHAQHMPSSSSTLTPTSLPSTPTRTFAILESVPGANPFDIGPAGNFRQVMGYTFIDWILPLRLSPLVDHSGQRGMYKYGDVVEDMASKAGIRGSSESGREGALEKDTSRRNRHGRKSRRTRRSDSRSKTDV